MKTKRKHFKWLYLLISAILCTTGILVMAYPTESLVTISYIFATFATIAGVILFAKLIVKKTTGVKKALYILLSLSTITCGVIAFVLPEEAMNVYPMFIGLFVIIDGAFKLHKTITVDCPKDTYWWFMFWTACITFLMGFFVVRVRVGDVKFGLYAFLLGFSILMSGIANFLVIFLTVGTKKKKNANADSEPKNDDDEDEAIEASDDDDYVGEDDENADTRYMRVCDIDDYDE